MYFALVLLVSAVSCSVIRNDHIQSDDQVERMKRELNPELLSITFDKNDKIASDSLVQGISQADFQEALKEVGRETQVFANEFNKALHEVENELRNSAHTSSVSMRVMLGTVIMALVKMMI